MDRRLLTLKILKPKRKKKGIIHYQLRFSLNFGEERGQDTVELLHFSLYSHTQNLSTEFVHNTSKKRPVSPEWDAGSSFFWFGSSSPQNPIVTAYQIEHSNIQLYIFCKTCMQNSKTTPFLCKTLIDLTFDPPGC